jgi:hypothetical protein
MMKVIVHSRNFANSHIRHCTHDSEYTVVKLQNIKHGKYDYIDPNTANCRIVSTTFSLAKLFVQAYNCKCSV